MSRPEQTQQTASLFDHLVGTGEQRGRNVNAERPSRLQVDDELKPGRQLDWHIGWILALEDATGVDAGQALRSSGRPSRKPCQNLRT
jgi:hypothetical protein